MKLLLITFLLLITNFSFAAKKKNKDVNYKTSFGSCPSKTTGELTLRLLREFEKNNSLKQVKSKIVSEKYKEKYFLKDYSIKYDPLKNYLAFRFDCPEPLLKIQIYKKTGKEYYSAILVEGGEILDPLYEVILRSENKLQGELPYLALPVEELKNQMSQKIAILLESMDKNFRSKLSEIILTEKKELTFIISIDGNSTSAFLGAEFWREKTEKLIKVLGYLEKKKKIPSMINLTSLKKVVVKFSRNL